ncbi:hypothetical protein AgCh_015854 [Apium graveolens]
MKTNLESSSDKGKRKLEDEDDSSTYSKDLKRSENFEVGDYPVPWVHHPQSPGDHLQFYTGASFVAKVYDISRSSKNCKPVELHQLLCYSKLAMTFYNIKMGTQFFVVKVLMATSQNKPAYTNPCRKIQILFVRIKPDYNTSNNSQPPDFTTRILSFTNEDSPPEQASDEASEQDQEHVAALETVDICEAACNSGQYDNDSYQFRRFVADAEQPLYEGTDYTKLESILKLHNWKSRGVHADATKCPKCRLSRWKLTKKGEERVNLPAKVMWVISVGVVVKPLSTKQLLVNDEDFVAFDSSPPSGKKGPQSCELALDCIENKVAFGTVFDDHEEMNVSVHGVPLKPGHVRVSVDGHIQPEASVPVPIPSEIEVVRQAVGSHVAWPRELIIYPTVAKKKKEVLHGQSKRKDELQKLQDDYSKMKLNKNVPKQYKPDIDASKVKPNLVALEAAVGAQNIISGDGKKYTIIYL